MSANQRRGRTPKRSPRNNKGASSKGVPSGFEDLEKEIQQFSLECPEIWIKCTNCQKWRSTRLYYEAKDVPEDFTCSMWVTEDGKKGSCRVPGRTESPDNQFEEFPEGTVVWAKMPHHLEWPGMIESEPISMVSWKETKRGKQYNVTFFGPNPSRSWIWFNKLRKFENTEIKKTGFTCQKLISAISQGNEAIKTGFQKRIKLYSLSTLVRAKRKISSDLGEQQEDVESDEETETTEAKKLKVDGEKNGTEILEENEEARGENEMESRERNIKFDPYELAYLEYLDKLCPRKYPKPENEFDERMEEENEEGDEDTTKHFVSLKVYKAYLNLRLQEILSNRAKEINGNEETEKETEGAEKEEEAKKAEGTEKETEGAEKTEEAEKEETEEAENSEIDSNLDCDEYVQAFPERT